jgi:hypothetical protein
MVRNVLRAVSLRNQKRLIADVAVAFLALIGIAIGFVGFVTL